jgi:hypothetical protein
VAYSAQETLAKEGVAHSTALLLSGDDKGADAVAQSKVPERRSLEGTESDYLPGILAEQGEDMIQH